jgi:hypothetical protein
LGRGRLVHVWSTLHRNRAVRNSLQRRMSCLTGSGPVHLPDLRRSRSAETLVSSWSHSILSASAILSVVSHSIWSAMAILPAVSHSMWTAMAILSAVSARLFGPLMGTATQGQMPVGNGSWVRPPVVRRDRARRDMGIGDPAAERLVTHLLSVVLVLGCCLPGQAGSPCVPPLSTALRPSPAPGQASDAAEGPRSGRRPWLPGCPNP